MDATIIKVIIWLIAYLAVTPIMLRIGIRHGNPGLYSLIGSIVTLIIVIATI